MSQFWPEEEVAPRSSDPASAPYIRSYIFMRRAVGILAVVLPPLLVFGEPLVFDDRPFPLGSLSAYYYSGFREIFVGMLWAIGVFLILYKWPELTKEGRVSTYAGFAVLLVAVFPTGKPGAGIPTTPLQALLGEEWVERVHYLAAAVFIFLLARISHYWAKKRTERRRLHRACELAILAALAFAGVRLVLGWPPYGILVAEFVAVWAFAISWLATVERDPRPAT